MDSSGCPVDYFLNLLHSKYLTIPSCSWPTKPLRVKAFLRIFLSWNQASFWLIKDLPSSNWWNPLHSFYHWNKSILNISVKFIIIFHHINSFFILKNSTIPKSKNNHEVKVLSSKSIFLHILDKSVWWISSTYISLAIKWRIIVSFNMNPNSNSIATIFLNFLHKLLQSTEFGFWLIISKIVAVINPSLVHTIHEYLFSVVHQFVSGSN